MKNKIISILSLSALAACNTVEGVGKDLKVTGDSIEKLAIESREDFRKSQTENPTEAQRRKAYRIEEPPASKELETIPYSKY